ncbi:S41 family peptidase [Limibacter armeniacum]|uniref:S41 family peptidase n=1 Tax=Limibacter armeniacum TaxID=466084 RepID=UPI002FE5426C
MKKIILATLFLISCLSFVSCENLFMEPSPSEDPQAVFNSMWETVRDKYSFFEYKNIDWESIRAEYESRISPEMSDEDLFYVLADMLNELRDGHVNIRSRFDVSVYKGINRVEGEDSLFTEFIPDFYDGDILEERYFIKLDDNDEEIRIANGFSNKIFSRVNLQGGLSKIGYIRYSSFVNTINKEALDNTLKRFEDAGVVGLILDMRENGGGSLTNAFRLSSRLINVDESTVLETVYKDGPAIDSFTAPAAYSVKKEGPIQFTKPVALLINRNSFSATSYFAAIMRAPGFEHVRSFGNNTGGGGGLPSDFQLPNGWYYRFSTTRTYTPFIGTDQIYIGENQFKGANGSELVHPENRFDFEAGVPVEFPISNERFEAAQDIQRDYLMEATMRLIIQNQEQWNQISPGQLIDFEL